MVRKARLVAAAMLLSIGFVACSTPTAPKLPEPPQEEPEKPPPPGGDS
jgi:hypothetical protein